MDEAKMIKYMKIQIKTLKILPMTLAGFYFVNTLLGFFKISQVLINNLAGVSLIPLIYLYISSYALHFCNYHRMFLHYIAASNIFCIVNSLLGFPIAGIAGYAVLWLIAGVFLFLILYNWLKNK